MTALHHAWSIPGAVSVAETERLLTAEPHEGLGTYERRPCGCRFCGGIVPHPGGRFSALDTASRMATH